MVLTQGIPLAYKQTEIGVIPNDWVIKKLKELTQVVTGSTPPTKDKSNYGEEYLFAGPADLGKTVFISDTEKKLSEKGFNLSRKFPKNSILFTCIGSTIGKTGIASVELTSNQQINAIFPSESFSYLYIYYVLSYLSPKIRSLAGEQAVPQINKTQFQNTQIPIPFTKVEQTAIATILSDMDVLIETSDKLIAKKHAIKQGTMQELLTGKRRLPGFSEGWTTESFPNVCWFQEGPGVRTTQFTSSGVKLLNGTNINNGKLNLETTERFISEREAYGIYSHFLADEGDIIIACSGITIEKFHEKVTVLQKEHLPLCMNTSTMRFKVTSKKLIKSYLLYFLQSEAFKKQIGGQATGSAQLNFGPFHVKKVEIDLPEPKEQTAIAQVFQDMDEEINKLEQKMIKYKMLKQGIMQVLLTGKVRLI